MNGSLKKTSKTYYIADSEREQGQNLELVQDSGSMAKMS
jgi:hypothetical protein